MLGIAVAALAIGCLALYLEMARYELFIPFVKHPWNIPSGLK
jgi:hypothetical protein